MESERQGYANMGQVGDTVVSPCSRKDTTTKPDYVRLRYSLGSIYHVTEVQALAIHESWRGCNKRSVKGCIQVDPSENVRYVFQSFCRNSQDLRRTMVCINLG